MRRTLQDISFVLVARRVAVAGVMVARLAVPLAAQQAQPQPQPNDAWRLIQPPQSSLIFARDGSLIGEVGKEARTSVPLASLPAYVPLAFISVEDQRFYQHDGVDIVGIAGAIKDNLLGGRRGASTITQLVVGNMHPDLIDRTDVSLGRKLREQAAAREMERHYTKAQILEAFLNQIPFGHGWFGIDAAARHYFGTTASLLTLAQAATLAALPKGPAIYDPITNPDRAKRRRDLVLTLMADQGHISKHDAEMAKAQPLVTAPNAGLSARAPYFVDAVRDESERAGIPIARGGYRVYTTLDPALQNAANTALTGGLTRVEEQPGYRYMSYAKRTPGNTDYLEGALVAMDAATGEVRALVGGRNYAEAPFNRALNAVRQPGSAFKPIVYAAAVADSITPNTMLLDTAIAVPLPNGGTYRPANYDGQFIGPITMREALTTSRNVPAVQLGLRVGMDSVLALARRMGIRSALSPVPSSAIGASALRPIELVAAYTTFANLGVTASPRIVLRIDDAQRVSVWAPEPAAPALSLDPRVAFIVRDMMRDVVSHGTAASVRRFLADSIPVAGKTGTTNNNADVWFVGMTPELVAGVWIGFDRPRSIGLTTTGGGYAAPIWGEMMAAYYAIRPAGSWVAPGGLVTVQLNRATGDTATAETPPEQRYGEYFLEGTEPGARHFDLDAFLRMWRRIIR
jgi:penicillin-binding protein 1A